MGENADDMIGGMTCSECGTFFREEHGYPVLCEGCWKPGNELPKADEEKEMSYVGN